MYTEIYRDYAYHVYPICTTSRTKHLKKLQPHLTGLNHSALQQGNSENRCHMTPTQTMHYYNKNPWKLPYISNCLIPPTNGSHFITPGKSLWKKNFKKTLAKRFWPTHCPTHSRKEQSEPTSPFLLPKQFPETKTTSSTSNFLKQKTQKAPENWLVFLEDRT